MKCAAGEGWRSVPNCDKYKYDRESRRKRTSYTNRNCLPKDVIEGKIEVMGRRRRRRKQLLDDFNL